MERLADFLGVGVRDRVHGAAFSRVFQEEDKHHARFCQVCVQVLFSPPLPLSLVLPLPTLEGSCVSLSHFIILYLLSGLIEVHAPRGS